MKKKWTTGKIIGVSMLLVLGVVILWIAFVASVYQLATVIEGIERTTAGRAGITGDSDDMDGYDIEDVLNGDSPMKWSLRNLIRKIMTVLKGQRQGLSLHIQ